MPVDGTTKIMECSIHNFRTEDPLVWYAHLDTDGHFEVGHSVCGICGQKVVSQGEAPSKLFLKKNWQHEECKK